MRITIQSVDLPEATLKNFAIFLGWQEKIINYKVDELLPIDEETGENPNLLEVDNPQTFLEYIGEKYGTPIWNDIANWNLQTAGAEANLIKEQANSIDEEAKSLADQRAKQVVSIIIE